MRLAPRIRPVAFGLPILICQLSVHLSAAGAWESVGGDNAAASTRSAAGSLRFVTPVSTPETRSVSHQESSAPASDLRIVDPALQQAGWNGPLRTAAGSATPHSAATNSRADARPSGRRGPIFRGREVNFPSGLFSRNKDAGPDATERTRNQATANRTANRPIQQVRTQVPAAAAQSEMNAQARVAKPTATNAAEKRPQPVTVKVRSSEQRSQVETSNSQPAPRVATKPANAGRKSPATPPEREDSQKTVVRAPQSPAQEILAEAHQLSGQAETEEDYTRIIETCRRSLVSQPTAEIAGYANDLAAWSLNRRGQLKAEAGDSQQAMLDFDDAIRADPMCWRAVHNRGVLLAQDGEFERAFDDFNRTIQINPNFAKVYANRGALFVVANNLNAALEDYGRSLELDANLAIAHRGRARVCHLLGRLDEAIAHYDAAVQLAPTDAYAIASRADLLTDLGRYVDANAEYDLAIELDPESLHAHSGSAWLLATCPDEAVRNPAMAIERAKRSIELSGRKDAVSFDTLAAAQAASGDFESAVQTVRQAIDLATPDERDVYQNRLVMYEHARAYRIAPVRPVAQASYEAESRE